MKNILMIPAFLFMQYSCKEKKSDPVSFSDYQKQNSIADKETGSKTAFIKNDDQNKDCNYCKDNVFYSSTENDGHGPSAEYIRSPKYTVLNINDHKDWKKRFYVYDNDMSIDPTFLLYRETDTLFTFSGTINWFCGIAGKYLFVETNLGTIRIYDMEKKQIVTEVNYFNSSYCYAKIGRWNADPAIKFDGQDLYFLELLKRKDDMSTSGSFEAIVQEVKMNLKSLEREKLKQYDVNIFPARN